MGWLEGVTIGWYAQSGLEAGEMYPAVKCK